MPRIRTCLAIGLALGLGCEAPESQSQDAEGAAEGTESSAAAAADAGSDEDLFYALGLAFSRNLASFSLDAAEFDLFTEGLRDGTLGNEPRVDLDSYGPQIQTLAQERRAAKTEAEKTASAAFLADEAGAEGATTSETGLVKRVLTAGDGPSPAASDTVRVHYHGTLRDGTVFDSSVDRGEPATFPLNRVVPCWTEALQTMQVGEKARIVCPSDIAYGDRGSPPRIQPGAALAFEVELLEIVAPPTTP